MSDLATWAERVIGVVEGDGATAVRIELVTSHDLEVWETWHAPFGKADEWCTQAHAYMRSLEAEWPTRKVQILFQAKAENGEVLSRLPLSITGKNRAGALDSAAAAQSVAFDQIALTIEKLQRLCNTQLDAARRTSEVNAEVIFQQTQLIRVFRERDLLGDDNSAQAEVLGAIKDNMPEAMRILEKAFAGKKNNSH